MNSVVAFTAPWAAAEFYLVRAGVGASVLDSLRPVAGDCGGDGGEDGGGEGEKAEAVAHVHGHGGEFGAELGGGLGGGVGGESVGGVSCRWLGEKFFHFRGELVDVECRGVCWNHTGMKRLRIEQN